MEREATQVPAPGAPGEAAGQDALFGVVYARLKAMAGTRLARQGRQDTLDTTALVHELYLRISTDRTRLFGSEAQFFAYAARAMRHLLLDRARDRMRQCAGGDWQRVTLTAPDMPVLDSAARVLDLERALQRLESADARAARVVELRCFAGLSLEQVAEALALTRRTIDRDWRFARAFLQAELG